MATDPFATLEQEHRQVEQLFATLAQCGPEQRQSLVAELEQALTRHMQFEEAEIYPLVGEKIDREVMDEVIGEHEEARGGLAQMKEQVNGEGFTTALQTTQQGIMHHVQEEEGEVFPRLREQLDDQTKQRLAEAKGRMG